MRDNWKCQSKLQKKQPYRKQQPLGGNPRTNPVHKNRKCHRVKIFTFLIASYDEAARVRMQTNRILFAWLSTDAGIDEKGVGVMCLQLEETNWFSSSSRAEGPYNTKKTGWGTCWVAQLMEAKAKALVLAGLGDASWNYIFLIFPSFFFNFLVYHIFSLLPHGSDRFRYCWH